MKSISIKGTKRDVVGKKEAKRLRALGLVPGVLYGLEEPIHFEAPEKEFKPLIYTPNVYLVDLDIDGTVCQSIIQDTQFHPVREQLMHVDFLRTSDDKMVKVEIPVKTEGFAKGIRKGGKLKLNLRTLKVKALVKHLFRQHLLTKHLKVLSAACLLQPLLVRCMEHFLFPYGFQH